MPLRRIQRGLRGPYVVLSPENKDYLKAKLRNDKDPQAVEILEKIEHTEDDAMVQMRQPHK